MFHGTADVFVKDHARKRARDLSTSPRKSGRPIEQIATDVPDAVARGSVVRSPSPDGPLALGFVS